MKFLHIVAFGGNDYFLNINYIESVFTYEGKTRICTIRDNGYFDTDMPIEEVMKQILTEKG